MNNNLGYYDEKELKKLGLKKIGNNVKLSKFAQIYDPKNISIGDNVRIDDFCVLIGNIEIEAAWEVLPSMNDVFVNLITKEVES